MGSVCQSEDGGSGVVRVVLRRVGGCDVALPQLAWAPIDET